MDNSMKTQGKVSMVMPCYNKAEYIGDMFDSIIAQVWDNIELILVNDGSTDGTRKVISEYESRFRERGYEVVIVDQDNKGACAAVSSGLKIITGKYVSLIDADDLLDPKYVSTMAEWLENHDDCEYCCCDYLFFSSEGVMQFIRHPMYMDGEYSIELFLAKNSNKAAWNFLVRTSYYDKCKIIDYYDGLGHCSYEPGFCIPLAAYNGKMKAFDNPLYLYNIGAEGMSRNDNYQKFINYANEYYGLTIRAFDILPEVIIDKYKRRFLLGIASFYRLVQLYQNNYCVEYETEKNNRFDELLFFVNNWLGYFPKITHEQTKGRESVFIKAVEFALIGGYQKLSFTSGMRIIGYGALGKSAENLIPLIMNTPLEPTELWDKHGDGTNIKRPEFELLSELDLLLVFSAKPEIVREVQMDIKNSDVRVLYKNEIIDFLSLSQFPQLARL